MNKLKKINELAEEIKLYGGEISEIYENIDIDLDYFEEDNEELFVNLKINENYIRFEIDKKGVFYIETSLNKFEQLYATVFWATMYLKATYNKE
ncbi:hypothetical protein C4N15_06925 [Fusobacterium necrophorum subsp. funduliforme]|uniref:hypothetical protein n=1 Tax=Fusobacterium necrophorum TaxID=859 RepID=UPI000D125CE4|nr:hypothetical protein [Fusobacterium necrophorum]AVQ21388.1 hypothetical protein C4N15_06925 [Fusobacterium necrophorum subsp. funduliforme]